MDQFPNNSKTAKSEPTKEKTRVVERVVEGPVIERKKSIMSRFKATFFNKADAKDISSYVMFDILLPATRNLLYDIIAKGTSRALFGDSSPRRDSNGLRTTRMSYSDIYGSTKYRDLSRPAMLPQQPPIYRSRSEQVNIFSDIIVSSKSEAETVVERLVDIIDKYQAASVADLKQLLGLPTAHIDNKWGWTDIRAAEVRQVREGYLIDIPLPEPIS